VTQPLCHLKIVTWTFNSSANSKLYGVAQNERREVGLKGSVETDTGSIKRETSTVVKAIENTRKYPSVSQITRRALTGIS
jgi:hypothetical protein